ncbi:nuclear transport factor 2 family protein [Catellatospora sp. NPDC049133]|jgi:ketosteroid isomerase-like protein|uniref:nuclear transport factor 2 family protein n=1 Tax=Catellatospora sp. NPDC049133 TaxID=3155499 RepID=UPI0033D87425
MSTVDWSRATTIAPAELPATITAYLAAHQARDVETEIRSYTADAVVADDGRVHRGRDEIRAWLSSATVEYTYTTELTGAARVDDEHYDVLQHLEGDFPGAVVDLHYRFTLRGSAIAELAIEV